MLPRRRQHLLRRYADRRQPRARHPRRRSLRGGEPVRHRTGARGARRANGDRQQPRRATRERGGLLHRSGHRHHAHDHARARGTAHSDPDSGHVGRRAVLFRKSERAQRLGLPVAERRGGGTLFGSGVREHSRGGECRGGAPAAPARGGSRRRRQAAQRSNGGSRGTDRHSRGSAAALQRLQDPVDAEPGQARDSRGPRWLMDFVRWGLNPWGQNILEHVSWTLFWASLFAGLMLLVAHGSYMLLSAHRKRSAAETDKMEAAHAHLPTRIERHSLMARAFHWVMAAAMFVLLFTAFLPVVGVKFAWVTWHWIAGIVLTGSIIFHIVHASLWLDFWSIWVGPKDIPEFKAEMLRELGRDVPGPKSGKYPLGNRLYHTAIVIAGLAAV